MEPDRQRVLRSDAVRNRRALIEAASKALADTGDSPTLNSIATDAGVGIGTLFRHFSSREELIEAVNESALAQLCAASPRLAASRPAIDALREWFHRFVSLATTRPGLAETLRTLLANGASSGLDTHARLADAVATLLDGGIATGDLREDLSPEDVLAAAAGIALIAGRPEQRAQAKRLIDLLIDGLRRSE